MNSQETYSFAFPTAITYGPGSLKSAVGAFQAWGCTKPLIVTDRDIAKLPFLKDIEKDLSSSGLKPTVYSEIWGNPVKSQVENGQQVYKGKKCDSILAIGGGAALDVAKVIGLMANHPGDVFDYEDGKPGALPIDKAIPLTIAVPTTAGTGSEVGRSSVISDDHTKIKKIIYSPKLLPSLVLLDPELTLKLPATVTAATGLDALTHLVEAYLSIGFHPMCDGIALEGIRLVKENLVPAYSYSLQAPDQQANHIEACGKMLLAASMGAVAFQKGLGVTHSCAHALSTVCDTHHGLANGVMLPYCLRFNAELTSEKFVRMSEAAGLPEKSADGFIRWTEELQSQLQIPTRLSQIDVNESHLDNLIEVALADGCHQLNPKPVNEDDFKKIFTEAL